MTLRGGGGGPGVSVIMTLIFSQIVWMWPLALSIVIMLDECYWYEISWCIMHLSIEIPTPTRIRGIDSPRGGAFVKMADSEKKVWCAWESTRERSASLPHQMDTNPHLIPTPEWELGGRLHQKNAPGVGHLPTPHVKFPTLTRGGGGGGGGGGFVLIGARLQP